MQNVLTKTLAFSISFLVLPLQGHEDDGPQHLIEHLRSRSAKGEPQATYLLGREYDRGGILVKNEKKAIELYKEAADLGSSAAQWILAGKYSSGKGVNKDKVEAYKWALLSVENGSEVARKLISKLEKGLSKKEKLKGQKLATKILKEQNSKSSNAK